MRVPFHQVQYGEEEVQAVLREMEDNWFSPRGPKLPELGQKWADYVGKSYGWPVSSGTAAIHLALLALGIGPGDRVAVPSYTCSPTVYPVTYVGAEPVFVDCELETYGMDPDHLEHVLRATPRVKAAVVVHLYGAACRTEVLEVCRKHGAFVVEDACESDGALYRNTDIPVGRWGDVACYSLRGDKVMTALGTGGIFLTDDPEWFRLMKLYSDLGLKNDSTMGRYRDLEVVGYNYEISNPAAAFGIAQIDRLPEIIAGRRRVARMWRKALARYRGSALRLMPDYEGHVWYQFPLLFEALRSVEELDRLGGRLVARGVPLIPPFWPMHRQPAYKHIEADCPRADYCSQHVLLFPCYPALAREQVDYMAQVIIEEYACRRKEVMGCVAGGS